MDTTSTSTTGALSPAIARQKAQQKQRKRQLEAELKHMLLHKDYAGAAAVQGQIQAHGASENSAGDAAADRQRAIEDNINSLVARQDYAGAAALKQTIGGGHSPSLEQSGGVARDAGEDVVVTIRAICTEGTPQYQRMSLRSVCVLTLSKVTNVANNKFQKSKGEGRSNGEG